MGKIKAIITGTTGMVGEGVLHVCLNNPDVEEVLIINRRPLGLSHARLKEVVHPDLDYLTAIEDHLVGYNACCFCLGISSVGISKEDYYKTTYMLTMHVAQILSRLNSGMTFCYISGAGTNSKEKGTGWAAVKGKTENDLMKLPFKQVFAFRPGFIKPIKGLTRTHNFYKYVLWLFYLARAVYPAGFCTMQELALAMIKVTKDGHFQSIIAGKDIIVLGKQV